MKISVIVRTFDSEKTIGKCLNGIFKSRLPKNIEVIVVDNASTDRTLQVLKKFNVKIVRELQRGFSTAINAGIKKASGELIIFCDDDVIVSKNWVEELLKPMQKMKSVAGVSGPVLPTQDLNFFGKCVAALGYPGGGYKRIFEEGSTQHPSMNLAVRKKVFEKIGLFDESFKFGNEDTDFFIRALKEFKFWFNPKAVVYHKVRDNFWDFAKWWFRRGKADIALHKKHMPSFPFSLFSPKHSRLLRLSVFVLVSGVLWYYFVVGFWVWIIAVAAFTVYGIARQQKEVEMIKEFLKLPGTAYWSLIPFLGFSSKIFRETGRIKGFF